MKLPSFLQFTQNYHIRGKVSLSLHSPVNLLLCPPSPRSIKDMLTIRKFRKEERMSTWLKDGFSCRHLLQSMDDYHSYCYYEFLFLLVPHLSVISPAFSLQLPYKTSQPPPPTTSQVLLHARVSSLCSPSMLHCRPSCEEQGREEQKACD